MSARLTCSIVVRNWATGTIGTSAIGPAGCAEGDADGPGDGGPLEPSTGLEEDGDERTADPAAITEPGGLALAPGAAPLDARLEIATETSTAPTAITRGRRFTDLILAQKNAPSGRADGA
jgi:hypothetical protein